MVRKDSYSSKTHYAHKSLSIGSINPIHACYSMGTIGMVAVDYGRPGQLPAYSPTLAVENFQAR